MPRKRFKATNLRVTAAYLAERTARLREKGYGKPKWIQFCEAMLARGLGVTLYEARKTVSKYVTVHTRGKPAFKVRFSNHRPNRIREDRGGCDFFVGVANNAVTTTEQAIAATLGHFGMQRVAPFETRLADTVIDEQPGEPV